MPPLFNCMALVLSLGFANFLSAQHYKAKLLSHEYFVVQHGDTIRGHYDTLKLKDGKFEQHIRTTFSGVGDRKLHVKGDTRANANDRVEIQTHVTVSGALGNGEPIGEWLFYTSDFKDHSTCYGDLSWRRVNYQNPDTIFIAFWNGEDYYNKQGRLLGGMRFGNVRLVYYCDNDTCTVENATGEGRLYIPRNEIEMMLERISFRDFRLKSNRN